MCTRIKLHLIVCRCKKLSPARKQMSVYRAPNVLVIQMKVRHKSVSTFCNNVMKYNSYRDERMW